MKTITLNTLARGATVMGLLLPISLVAGCGGGGSGPSTPKATPTPTKAPTPTPTPATQAVGTYRGTYAFPASGEKMATGGTFILRVQSSGTATGVFNEETTGRDDDISITTSGTVNLASGQIALSGSFSDDSSQPPLETTVTVSGVANATGASGPAVASNSDGTRNGTFTTTKTSASPTAVPMPDPLPTPAPGALVKRTGKSGLKRGRL